MRTLLIKFPLALLALTCGAVAVILGVVYPRLSATTATCPQVTNDPWHELNEYEKVKGRVRVVLIEITEMGTADPPEELFRSPFLELQFDNEGRIIKKTGFRDDGALLPPRTYEYDDQNRLIRENYYGAIRGDIIIVTTYSYDTAGRPSGAISKSLDSYPESELSKEVYIHSPGGNYSEKAEYWDDALRYKYGYKTDSCGRVVELLRLSEMVQGRATPKYTGKTIFSRDGDGNVIKAESYDSEGKLEEVKTINYEFDPGGNWTKRTAWRASVSDGKLSKPTKEVVYRTVSYF